MSLVRCKYRKISKDENSWIEENKIKPNEYDLVQLKTLEGRIITGWWTGRDWHAPRFKRKFTVISWRRGACHFYA